MENPGYLLRKTFEYDGGELKNGAIVISCDEDTEVYINGQKIFEVQVSGGPYKMRIITAQLKNALKKGSNTIAVHTQQTKRGQHIDLAVLID